MDSILTSIKNMLGIVEEYEEFDTILVLHINSVFSVLAQLGVGPSSGFSITDKTQTWHDFINSETHLEMLKSYMYLKVKLLFDPPLGSASIDAINRQINELEWRLNVATDHEQEHVSEIEKIKEDVALLKQHDILSSTIT